jgi:RNA polymerase primary sigma factor
MPTRKKTLPPERATAAVNIPSIETGLTVRPEIKPASPSQFDQASPVDRRDERSNLQLYLNEIRQTPLLTIAEEIQLAARIKKGDKAARDHMIKANLRLVVKIAYDYHQMGLPLMDLISEGNLGLIKAVERFDPAKGGKLSTYAAWWIKQSMKRALGQPVQDHPPPRPPRGQDLPHAQDDRQAHRRTRPRAGERGDRG